MTEPMLLFVYGTLRRAYTRLPQSIRQMNPPHVLHTFGQWVSEATLQNHAMFNIDKYPGIVASENFVVRGDIFRIAASEEVMKVLDEYEGIANIYEEPYEYRRVEAEVVTDDGEQVRAWVYVYNWEIRGVTWIESGDFVEYCLRRVVGEGKPGLKQEN